MTAEDVFHVLQKHFESCLKSDGSETAREEHSPAARQYSCRLRAIDLNESLDPKERARLLSLVLNKMVNEDAAPLSDNRTIYVCSYIVKALTSISGDKESLFNFVSKAQACEFLATVLIREIVRGMFMREAIMMLLPLADSATRIKRKKAPETLQLVLQIERRRQKGMTVDEAINDLRRCEPWKKLDPFSMRSSYYKNRKCVS